MQFKISDRLTRKLYLRPVGILFFFPLAILLGVSLMGSSVELESLPYLFILFGLFPAFFSYRNKCDFRDYAKLHYIEIVDKGLISHELDVQEMLLWESIKEVKVKYSKHKVKSIKLKGYDGLTIDLSRYENLDLVATELEKYVEASKWI